MSRGFRAVVRLLVLAGVVGALVLWWPTETRRITRMIERLAADASFRPGDGNIIRLAKLSAVTGRFTDDATIRLESLGLPLIELSGRDEIQAAVGASHQRLAAGLDLKIFDVVVTFGPLPETARAELTASLASGKQEGFTAQEFALRLVKREQKWLIQHIEPMRTLRR